MIKSLTGRLSGGMIGQIQTSPFVWIIHMRLCHAMQCLKFLLDLLALVVLLHIINFLKSQCGGDKFDSLCL